MTQFLAGIVTRMNRIRDLSKDLSRELMRPGHSAQMTRIIVAAIKADTDAVWLALNRKKRQPLPGSRFGCHSLNEVRIWR